MVDGREKGASRQDRCERGGRRRAGRDVATGETQSLEDPEPTTGSVKKKVYVRELERLQIELVKQQETIRRQGHKVVESDSKRRAHLNCITHLLSQVPYEEPPVEAIVLPPRQAETGYVRSPMSEQRFVPSVF